MQRWLSLIGWDGTKGKSQYTEEGNWLNPSNREINNVTTPGEKSGSRWDAG